MTDEFEIRVAQQVADVVLIAREQVIQADYIVAFLYQAVT